MSSGEKLECVFCKESFEDKEALQVHFRKHADPTFNKPNSKIKNLHDEPEVSKEKTNNKDEIVSCDVCTEVFPTISKAITHKHKVHPDHDTKYFCEWCGKLFTLKHLYSKHLVNHGSMTKISDEVFHCDCCNVDFNVPSAMVYHNKFFHRQDMELPAIGHSKKQKLVSQELLALYYCAFCGEEYINKVNLHKHMADDHGDENQSPEDILKCPLCEAIFYHLDAFEVHLTFHDVGDIYSGKEMNDDDLTDFTIESVPPILEKVENLEEGNSAMNIDQLLQLPMDDTEKTKQKKHKKHKKSKKEKAAITLDEFLNMNTDVFGEDLNFQGVEEIPSKVVKQLKAKSKPQQARAGTKSLSTKDLEKLKQQGIIVKKKSQNVSSVGTALAPGTKVITGKPINFSNNVLVSQGKQFHPGTQIKTNPSNAAILSKLINQNQSQIKITKKPVEKKVDIESKQNITIRSLSSNIKLNSEETKGDTPENIEVECDLLPRDSEPSSEIDAEENAPDNNLPAEFKNPIPCEIITTSSDLTSNNHRHINTASDLAKYRLNSEESTEKQDVDVNDSKLQEYKNSHEKGPDKLKLLPAKEIEKLEPNSTNVLKNLSHQLTIKPVKLNVQENRDFIGNKNEKNIETDVDSLISHELKADNETIAKIQKDDHSKTTPEIQKEELASRSKINKALNNFKNLQHQIKIKSSNPTESNEYEGIDQNEDNFDNIETEAKTKENQIVLNDDKNNSLNLLRKLGISVKSNSQPIKNENDSTQKEGLSFTNEGTGSTLNHLKNLGITVKSKNPTMTKYCTKHENSEVKKNVVENKLKNIELNETILNKSETQPKINEYTENSLNILKNIVITVKPKSVTESTKIGDVKNEEIDEPNLDTPTINKILQKQNIKESSLTTGKSLNVLKSLGITVKSTKELDDLDDFDNDQHGYKDELKSNFDDGDDRHKTSVVSQENKKGLKFSLNSNSMKSLKQSQSLNSVPNILKQNNDHFQHNNEEHASDIEEELKQNVIHNKNVMPKLPEGITVKAPCLSPKSTFLPKSSNTIEKCSDNIKQKILNYPVKSADKTNRPLKNLNQNFTIQSTNSNKYQNVTIQSTNSDKTQVKSYVTEESEIFNVDDSDDDAEDTQMFTKPNETVGKINLKNNYSQNIIPAKLINTTKDFEKHTILDTAPLDTTKDNFPNDWTGEDHNEDEITTSSLAKLINNKNISLKNMQSTSKYVNNIINKNSPNVQSKKLLEPSSVQTRTINSFDDFLSNESSDDDNITLKKNDTYESEDDTFQVPCESTMNESTCDDHEFGNDDIYSNDQNNIKNQSVINKLKNINQNLTIKSNKSNDQLIKNVSKSSIHATRHTIVKNKSCVLKRDFSELNIDSDSSQCKQLKINKEDALESEETAKLSHIGIRQLNQGKVMKQQQLNQEVTTSVKTIQTKTVVQEITTTVTRTIKTLNQEISTNQQTAISNVPVLSPPKIVQGMKISNPQIKNYQGTAIRQSMPVHRPRTKPMIPSRPATNSSVRIPNQNVFVRQSGINQLRPVGPRMPVMKTVQSNPRQPLVKKPLKFASNVIKQRTQMPEPEIEGHFSCFKKPKETLMPGSHESSINVASSSHVSKANFTSQTKTIKGNNVVTATQIKSEVHTSSQQMNRLNNVPGLSVMKSSQSKEVVREVNKSVIGGNKRSTQDAIEKLQRLGLSVKKPRIDEPEDSENSDFDDEDHDGSLLAIESGGYLLDVSGTQING